jgi:hypothetical protein
MSATAILEKPVFEKAMNAAIIYDDFPCATKASAMLASASSRAGEIALWNVKPWRLDLLNLPPTAAEALRDTADVHLIVFALRPAQSLPIGLMDWLEQWAALRQVGEAALAVFTDGSGETLPASAVPELSRFAERQGLNLIFHDSSSVQTECAVFLRNLHEREVSITPTLHQIMDESANQHWGINE